MDRRVMDQARPSQCPEGSDAGTYGGADAQTGSSENVSRSACLEMSAVESMLLNENVSR